MQCDATGQLLRDIVLPGSGVLAGVVERQGETSIPRGDFKILPGDKVTVQFSPYDLNRGRIVYRAK